MRSILLALSLPVVTLPGSASADPFCSGLAAFLAQWPSNAASLPQEDGPPAFDFPDWLQPYAPSCYARHTAHIVTSDSTIYYCTASSGDDDMSVAIHRLEVNSGQNPRPLPRPLAESDAAGLADAIGQCLGVPVQKVALTGSNRYQLVSGRTTITVLATEFEGDHQLEVDFSTPD